MEKFNEKLAGLINVKTLVTFVITFVFGFLAIRGDIAPDAVMNIVAMVLAFYFGTQYEQNKGEK
jgi:uncharacterized membrane protein (DUF4010 family)